MFDMASTNYWVLSPELRNELVYLSLSCTGRKPQMAANDTALFHGTMVLLACFQEMAIMGVHNELS